MNKLFLATTLAIVLAPLAQADTTNVLADEKARVSYAIGLNFGHGFKQQNLDLDPELVGRAIKDVLVGNPELMTEAEVKETLTAFQKEFRAKQQARAAQIGIKNKADGEAFLATNKNQSGVNVLPDGLQYLVLTAGSGAKPGPGDTVSVNYRGTLLDGTEFDSSYKRGQPTQFPVGNVIRGWTEALQMMPAGSKWKLFIPSDLAYGEQGRPGIPPNSTLIFEVELLSTQPQPPPAAVAPAQPLTSDIIKVPSAEEMKKGAKIEVIKPEDAAKAQQSGK